MEILEHVALKPYTTFKMGAPAAYFAEIGSAEDLVQFAEFARKKSLPLVILGGGSNVIFPDEGELAACVAKVAIKGFEIISQNETEAVIRVGAGEEWDRVVERSVELGLSGIEALSAIPGTAGATPVQNVGAYGAEIAHVLRELEAYDLVEKKIVRMSKGDCNFSYRDSIFKHAGAGRYVILSITLALSKKIPDMPLYQGVETYFRERGTQKPGLKEIRDAIIEIRKKKLPDPKDIASCGSFFKNPIVPREVAETIRTQFPRAIIFPVSENESKLGAGWMIDSLGLKGKDFGNLLVYHHNALVLVNKGSATKKELDEAVLFIQRTVKEVFGVDLHPEPVFVS